MVPGHAGGSFYLSKDARPDSAALQAKMRVVAIPWGSTLADGVEAYLADALPGGVCCGSSRSWACIIRCSCSEHQTPSALSRWRLQTGEWSVVWCCVATSS